MKIESTRRPPARASAPATEARAAVPGDAAVDVPSPTTTTAPACPVFALGGVKAPLPAPEPTPLDDLLPFAVGAAIAAYHDLDWGDQFALLDVGCAHVRFVSRGCQQALMFTLDGRAWIMFRGSDQSLDWLLNFAVLPFYHPGFRIAWQLLREPVSQWAQQVRGDASRCVIVGHSLGGAIATLAARAVRDTDTLPVEAVITLGAPRVGSARFASAYNATPAGFAASDATLGDRTLRLVNGDDPVPTVPPVWLGFRHVGHAQAVAQLEPNAATPPPLQVRDPVTFRRPRRSADAWLTRLQDALATYGRTPFAQLTRLTLWLGRSSLQHLRACYGAPLGERLAFTTFRPLPHRRTTSERMLRGLDRVAMGLIALLLVSPIAALFYLLIRTASEGAWALLVFELLTVAVVLFSPPDPY